MIKFIANKNQSSTIGYFLLLALLCCLLTKTFCLEHSYNLSFSVGAKIRTLLMDLIYKKSLKLSDEARAETQTGEMINLMQVDANSFAEYHRVANILWSGVLDVIISFAVLYAYIGNAVFAGIGALMILVPLNLFFAHKLSIASEKKLEVSDSRMKIINEVLNGIKVIKFYGWEISFEKIILDFKNKEIALLRKCGIFRSSMYVGFGLTSFVVIFLLFR